MLQPLWGNLWEMLGQFLFQHLVRLQSLKAYICLVDWCIHRFGGKFKYQTSQFERTDSSRKSVLKLWRVCQSENVKNSQDLHFKAAKGATGKSNKMVIFVRKKRKKSWKSFNFISRPSTLMKDGSPGPVVKGGDSFSEGHELKSQHQILDGHFSH